MSYQAPKPPATPIRHWTVRYTGRRDDGSIGEVRETIQAPTADRAEAFARRICGGSNHTCIGRII